MSIVPELSNEDIANSTFPATPHAKRWQQAAQQAAENLALILHAGDRLSKALHLVLANAVTINTDGTTQVRSGQLNLHDSPSRRLPL